MEICLILLILIIAYFLIIKPAVVPSYKAEALKLEVIRLETLIKLRERQIENLKSEIESNQ